MPTLMIVAIVLFTIAVGGMVTLVVWYRWLARKLNNNTKEE